MRRPVRFILVALAGHTPAVITETLWALEQQRGQRVDEIRVITTASGQRALAARLWGKEGHFTRYCRDYGLEPGRIAFGPGQVYVLQDSQGADLEDIRTHQDNAAAADQIFTLIREWTARPDEVLHGSVAGGRKTLGIYLTMAFMLCGRPEDSLSHVLVDPVFEREVPDFYYPPPQVRQFHRALPGSAGREDLISSAAARVDLADLPFLGLRELVGGQIPMTGGYLAAIRHSQALCRYLSAPPELIVCLHCRRLQMGDFHWRLSKQQLALYVFFLTEFNSPDARTSLADLFAHRARLTDLERQIDEFHQGGKEDYAWDNLRSLEDLQEKLTPIISKINRAVCLTFGTNEISRRLSIRRRPHLGVDIPRYVILTEPCPHC